MKLHEKLLKQICIYCGTDYSKGFDVLERLNLTSLDTATLETLDYLEQQKMIYHTYSDHRYIVYLTYAGRQYFETELANGTLRWIKKNILDLLAIAIAVIALLKP